MRLLHIAVLKERHEMVEYLAANFSTRLDSLDQAGRTALHYAAVQSNAIYDTLVDLGADRDIADQDGVTAEEYRQSPSRYIRPASAASSLMLRSMSTDDEFFDPDEPSAIPASFSSSLVLPTRPTPDFEAVVRVCKLMVDA
ncbi:unnamed protein product [Caenorhabditis auriculariae]|uniref:Uncharacterized protein n=1 Tax=Caenorhabditis auriculariae TaxID=2777116 RepID=A0A8S1H0A3_9PELO|nr:unnamed protein product [Caenorhabditis auriculariae]